MRLPDFLIIGGMKCGSTTLYRDLMTNPAVFFPIDKEPETLTDPAVLTDAGRAAYAELFSSARDDQICGEASTAYTKRPTFEGVAERARELLGPGLRVIYVVRNPVDRIASHHHHQLSIGAMPESLDDALESHPELLDYSRYAMQARPWIDALGPEHVRLVRFEDYTRDRAGTVADLSAFLGINPRPDLVQADRVYNKSAGKPVLTGPWRAVQGNPVYQRVIRPLLPADLKDRLRRTVLPKSSHKRVPPTDEQVARINEQLAADLADLADLLGTDGPVWPTRKAAPVG